MEVLLQTDSTFEIAVLPGDGIGADVVAEAVRVLREIEHRLDGVHFCHGMRGVAFETKFTLGDMHYSTRLRIRAA